MGDLDHERAAPRSSGSAVIDPAVAAENFILRGIQDWGQSDAERTASVQAILDAAGINARATCGPVFGGIWPTPCEGPEAERATAWLKDVTARMRRGRFQDEVAHVTAAIDEHRTAMTAQADAKGAGLS